MPPVHLFIILRCYCLSIESYLSAEKFLKNSWRLCKIFFETKIDLVDVSNLLSKLLFLGREHWSPSDSPVRLGLRGELNISSLPALEFLLQQMADDCPKIALAREQHLFNVRIQALPEIKGTS